MHSIDPTYRSTGPVHVSQAATGPVHVSQAATDPVHVSQAATDPVHVSQAAADVRTRIAHLRSHAPLPILFALRSTGRGGEFEGSDKEYAAICGVAVSCRDGSNQ